MNDAVQILLDILQLTDTFRSAWSGLRFLLDHSGISPIHLLVCLCAEPSSVRLFHLPVPKHRGSCWAMCLVSVGPTALPRGYQHSGAIWPHSDRQKQHHATPPHLISRPHTSNNNIHSHNTSNNKHNHNNKCTHSNIESIFVINNTMLYNHSYFIIDNTFY